LPGRDGKGIRSGHSRDEPPGEGIARIQGFVIFVPNAKPKDHVKIKITRTSQRFATAEIVK